MIIKSIEINNFLSYYGKQEFTFAQGATLIIGQNNTGKSKLFDAYNWVLYDEAFKTEGEKWEDTSFWKGELVNRLALKQCRSGANIEVMVALEFEDEDNNHFLITRNYKVRKISETELETPDHTMLQVTKELAGNHNTFNLIGEDATNELKKYFPKNLSRYFLFQGENISQLMRLNKRSDFTNAIGELSGIKIFAKAKQYALKVYERTRYEFEIKQEDDSAFQLEKEKLTKKIDDQKDEIREVTDKLDNEIKERDKKEELYDEKVEQLAKFEACATIINEIRDFEKSRDNAYKLRKVHFESNRHDVLTQWIYGKLKSQFQSFLSLYRVAKDEKKIPEPIRQDFIQEMLDQKQCMVCETQAPLGSAQYANIAKHLNPHALDQEVATINTLSDAADSMYTSLSNIANPVNDFKDELSRLQKEINRSRETINQKEDELRIVIERIAEELNQQITREDLEKINILQIKKDRDQFKNDLDKSKTRIAQLTGNKETLQDILDNLDAEYASLVDRSNNELEKNRMKLALQIKDQIDLLHDNFLFKLIGDIETETNTYFVSMTKTSEALSGRVRVNYEAKEVYTVDEQGIRMSNINQANKVSLQIAFVAAVLSVSNKIWNRYFPFVSDAPISALGGNNKISAIKTMIDIFRQSIIMLKDDANTDSEESINSDQVRQLIKYNEKIKNAYELKMQKTDSIQQQYTEVFKLK